MPSVSDLKKRNPIPANQTPQYFQSAYDKLPQIRQFISDMNDPAVRLRDSEFLENLVEKERLIHAEHDKIVVGTAYVAFPKETSLSSAPMQELGGLLVHRDAKQRGLGTNLVRAAVAVGQRGQLNDGHGIAAAVLQANVPVIRCLHRVGFEIARAFAYKRNVFGGTIQNMVMPGDTLIRGYWMTISDNRAKKIAMKI